MSAYRGDPDPRRRPIRILVVAGQPLLRTGYRTVLDAEVDLTVVAEAATDGEAVELARRLLPDVVLLDARARGAGVATTRTIVESGLPVRVLILARADLEENVLGALCAGARGFLPPEVSSTELAAAIRSVAAGDAVAAPRILDRLLNQLADLLPDPAATPSRLLDSLTGREREVLVRVARGRSNAEIAQELSVSETTVKTHVGNVLTKLRLRDRVQAVVLAYESGLIRPRS